jgi:acetyl esterase
MPDESELDPEVAALLDAADAMAAPPVQGLSVDGARARLEELFASGEVREVGEVTSIATGGPDGTLPVRLYEPEDRRLADEHGDLPALVFYHGGGWTSGSLDTHDNVCRALCADAGCAVLSVDYRLAPEHPFPAALEDAVAAYEWARKFGRRINVDPGRVAVGGDSAGGNLAAATALYARDERDRGGSDAGVPSYQLLIYPAVASPDLHEFDSVAENAEGYLLERASIEWYYDNYVDSPAHRRNAYLAPLLAGDHAGLPPATVVTAGFDPLRDEGRAYADALSAGGVEVRHRHYPGATHAFVSFTGELGIARESLATMADHLRDALS